MSGGRLVQHLHTPHFVGGPRVSFLLFEDSNFTCAIAIWAKMVAALLSLTKVLKYYVIFPVSLSEYSNLFSVQSKY